MRRRLTLSTVALALVASACVERPATEADSAPTAASQTSPTTSAGSGDPESGETGEDAIEEPADAALDAATVDAATAACDVFRRGRYADRVAALTEARSTAGFVVDDAIVEECPNAHAEFETLEGLAFNSASVNQNTIVGATCGLDEVTVAITNNNVFTIDTGVLVQIGSAEIGATGGTVLLTLGIASGETREFKVDPVEVGSRAGATTCGARVTAWEASTGATATIFSIEDVIEDPDGRELPQTRTDDPVRVVTELIAFETGLFGDPEPSLVEEFEDVRSPNFLRLIGEFGDRIDTGATVEFSGSEITDVRIIDRPRDDLMLIGWASEPGVVTFFDGTGSEIGSNSFGVRERRGIFLRSPEDGRWRWVHSAFTILEDGGAPLQEDDIITAGGASPAW